ncbi:hypothetical protein GGF44_005744, partial [Coemansia sp. RSA 1694]
YGVRPTTATAAAMLLVSCALKRIWISPMTRSRSSRPCPIRSEQCRRGYRAPWEAALADSTFS